MFVNSRNTTDYFPNTKQNDENFPMKSRLSSLVEHTGLSISQFEAKIGAGSGAIAKIIADKEGKNGISSKNLEKIFLAFPDYNLDWLLTGRGEILITVPSKQPVVDPPLTKVGPGIVTVDTSDHIIVPILDLRVAAGEPYILDEPDYVRNLPTLSFPSTFFRGGVRVAVPVKGDSMYPTIHQGDYVIARQVEQLTYLRNGQVYVVVYQEDHRLRFFVKRCFYFMGEETINLVSDNPDYRDEELPINSITRIYEVERAYTAEFSRPDPSRGRFDRIEKRIDRLSQKIELD
jgi:phage repressor protein C with HTH and peptisase S24 domain